MEHKGESISVILERELQKRAMAVGKKFSVEELFDSAKVADWMAQLLDGDKLSGLNERINMATPERLSHTAVTYLLGLALREQLSLNFDFLPRIFSHGAVGDAFYFFWSVICLCHDLGYQYERDGHSKHRIYDVSLMETSKGRCNLLNIRHDLFALDVSDLEELGIQRGSEEAWVLESLELAKKYSRLRRKAAEDDRSDALIDHGIAGALILYDALMKEYEQFRRGSGKDVSHCRNSAVLLRTHTGVVSANADRRRFAACAIIIACTVARHNIWNAKNPDVFARYRDYGLDMLCGDAVLISAEQPMEQLLFLLDFMDTIDPVKGLYTRKAEKHEPSDVLESWRGTLLNSVSFAFQVDVQQFRWEQALKYRMLHISIDATETEEKRTGFSDYAWSIASMDEWLKTKAPILSVGPDGLITSITCFYPSFPRQERVWTGNVREYEVTSLCLYAGGGSSKAGFFYQCRNAYQTFNLLMMDELEGERVRICRESQRPYGLYIKEWQRTLEVLTDIFTAQCKYASHLQDFSEGVVLKRVDRLVNFDMMKAKGETFAFTSTSTAGFLPEIAAQKSGLVLLDVKLNCKVPFVDYGGLLREAYVYSSEQEVLLPPFLKVKSITKESLSDHEWVDPLMPDGREVPKYTVQLGEFFLQEQTGDELELIRRLENNKDSASQTLNQMRKTRTLPPVGEALSTYLAWKSDFQALVRHCFFSIGRTYGWIP